MLRERIVEYRETVQSGLRAAFVQDHPPRLIAGSFAIGVFVTAMPSLGAGVLLLLGIAYRYEWANRLALFASVAILNPVVKTGVYAMSFALGIFLLGPVSELAVDAGPQILLRLFVGNTIIALVFAAVGYVLALYGVSSMRKHRTEQDG